MAAFAKKNAIPIADYKLLLQQPEINELIATETADRVSPKTGFKPFEPGRELSPKQDLLRHRIRALYAKEIHRLFKQTALQNLPAWA